MKTLKKTILLILMAGFVLPVFSSGINTDKDNEKVKVVYFHNTRRCETCLAIEEQTKNALKENFGDQMAEGLVTFAAYNFDDKANKKIIKELKVPGQALLVIKNGKQVDLTEKGFLYARTDPEKFKQIIREAVGDL